MNDANSKLSVIFRRAIVGNAAISFSGGVVNSLQSHPDIYLAAIPTVGWLENIVIPYMVAEHSGERFTAGCGGAVIGGIVTGASYVTGLAVGSLISYLSK